MRWERSRCRQERTQKGSRPGGSLACPRLQLGQKEVGLARGVPPRRAQAHRGYPGALLHSCYWESTLLAARAARMWEGTCGSQPGSLFTTDWQELSMLHCSVHHLGGPLQQFAVCEMPMLSQGGQRIQGTVTCAVWKGSGCMLFVAPGPTAANDGAASFECTVPSAVMTCC
ncbi:hypothetical protein ABBQ32_013218 [Trebouxia sp. C0010 RCD-2024]